MIHAKGTSGMKTYQFVLKGGASFAVKLCERPKVIPQTAPGLKHILDLGWDSNAIVYINSDEIVAIIEAPSD